MAPNRNRSGEYARRKAKCLQFNLCFQCQLPKGQNHFKCDECLAKNSARDRKRRQEYTIQNKCDCGRPSLPDFRVCEACREEDRLFQEKKREQHRLEGSCLTCGKPPVPGLMTCTLCSSRATISTMNRYHNNIISCKCAFCGNDLNQSTFRCDSCHEQHILRGKIYWSQKRLLILDHYGAKCQCCGLETYEFLDIDHINGGGNQHRQNIGRHFSDWIISNNYPSDLQLLCSNCNHGKSKFGICPHIQPPIESTNKRQRQRRRQRQRTIEQYGGECKCCGESNWAFLEFDHVNNDGAQHRKELSGQKLVPWIIKNNYPDTIQLLCSNCNKAKGLYGGCPHLLST
jgi:hypothetical protein